MPGSYSQAGFFFQNNIAAQKLLELLEFGSPVRSITLENYQKGEHIDDIIVETNEKTYYYQVKWSSTDNSPYTINNLISSNGDDKKSLFQELAEGYSRLHSKIDAEVILFSTRRASSQRFPKAGITKSLREFIQDIHVPILEGISSSFPDLPNYREYEPIIEKMRLATGLNQEAFFDFLKRLRFQFEEPDISHQRERVRYKIELLGIEPQLYDRLLTTVVEWSISGDEIKSSDVLERLGLSNRLLDSVVHDFKIEREYLVDNSRLFTQLSSAIDTLPGGFILVEGPPGTGKSTFLTTFRDRNPKVKFAYYCFIPSGEGIGNRRLEKSTLLKSLCVAIMNAFPDADLPDLYSDEYERKLNSWLPILSERGEKIVFIVDGLDHVDKNKTILDHPITDFLTGSPGANLFFVLSSQYLEALAETTQAQIKSDERRRIRIGRFAEVETREFLKRRGLTANAESISLIHSKSEGIPLYLYYITQLLLDLPSNDFIYQNYLRDLPALEAGEIDTYHEFLLQKAAVDNLALWILAILAHRREFTSEETLRDILQILEIENDPIKVNLALVRFRHLLRSIEGKGVTIFHNSFRDFILKRNTNLAASIAEAIIIYYNQNPETDEAYRNYFRHLFEAARYAEIVTHCDEDWLKRSWRNLRPFDEIISNLHIAWEATIRMNSLREFIRIAFLEIRFGRICAYFGWTEIYKPSVFLLDIGKTDEAVRAVWDGENINVPSDEFFDFARAYFKRVGTRLPKRIAVEGLHQFSGKRLTDKPVLHFDVRALYEPWEELLTEINDLTWRTLAHVGDQEGVPFTPEQNQAKNDTLKREVVESLFQSDDYESLSNISKFPQAGPVIENLCRVKMTRLLMGYGRLDEARNHLQFIDIEKIAKNDLNDLIITLAESGLGSEVEELGKNRFAPPKLFAGLVKEHPNFEVKDDLLGLYDNLRVYFFQNPNEINFYRVQAQKYTLIDRTFFLAIISLSELWIKSITTELDQRTLCNQIRGILTELSIDQEIRNREFQEKFRVGGDHYLSNSVDQIFSHVFRLATDKLDLQRVEEVVTHWLWLDAGAGGYHNLNSNIEFAKFLHNKHCGVAYSQVERLLSRAESQAREDEETLRLLESLIISAEGYGSCGFHNEALRIYQELFVLGCGVGDRKDYQFSEAIEALRRTHVSHPELSVNRVRKLLQLTHKLHIAADGRAVSRAVGDLIDFSASVSPALALELLFREDWVFTDEVIEGFTLSLPKLPGIDLRYLWAMVKTMSKWDDFRDYNEDTYPAMLNLFLACVGLGKVDLAEDIYEYARHQLIIEKGMPERIFEFSKAAVDKGVTFSTVDVDIELYRDTWNQSVEEKTRRNEIPHFGSDTRKQNNWKLPEYSYLKEQAERDFDLFERTLSQWARKKWIFAAKRDIFRFYEELRRNILGFENIHSTELTILLRNFGRFKRKILNLSFENRQDLGDTVRLLFSNLLEKVLSHDKLKETVKNGIKATEYKSHLDGLVRSLTSFSRGLGDEFAKDLLPRFIEDSNLLNLSRWKEVIEQYSDSYHERRNLLLLARKLAPINPTYAEELLDEIEASGRQFFFSGSQTDIKAHFDLLFELNPNKAKQVLLNIFYLQYKKYPQEVIYYLDKVLDYASRFDEPDIHEFAYKQYEHYNELLTEGLVEKETNYDWIESFPLEQSFEDSILYYLVRLFDHPEVEIRKLALNSLHELLKGDGPAVRKCISFCESQSDNSKEHLISLLHSIAIFDFELIVPLKNDLLAFAQGRHFNIDQGIKDLLMYCYMRGGDFTSSDIALIGNINVRPLISVPVIEEGLLFPGRQFIPSEFQATALYNMQVRNSNDNHLVDKIYTRLQLLGYEGISGMEDEIRTHRQHNINANFDSIEINGKYFQDVQTVLNESFTKEIKLQAYSDSDIQTLKQIFRLYDPSDQFITVVQKPPGPDWLGGSVEETAFLGYEDLDAILNEIRIKSGEWVTLFEDGHQRLGAEMDRRTARTCYFRVIPFIINSSILDSADSDILESLRLYLPVIMPAAQNLYRYELFEPLSKPVPPSIPVSPVVFISENKFRGQVDLSIATVLPHITAALNLQAENDYSLNYSDGVKRVIDFSKWQAPYDQDRRRQKPRSAGVILRIRRDVLTSFLVENNQKLCYLLFLKRSTDSYKEEEDMDWQQTTAFTTITLP